MLNKLLFALLVLMIAGSAMISWDRYIHKDGYITYTQLPCDPEVASCFVWIDPECAEDACEPYHYQLVFAPASLLRECQTDEGECLEAACLTSGECQVIHCSEASRDENGITDECS